MEIIDIISHKAECLEELETKITKALTMCGLTAEGYGKLECPVDTGNLRNSITNTVEEHTMYVGTNVEYGVYVEMGTEGKNHPNGSWVYRDSQGVFHRAFPQQPRPFVKPAVADHIGEYKTILQNALSAE